MTAYKQDLFDGECSIGCGKRKEKKKKHKDGEGYRYSILTYVHMEITMTDDL